MPGNSFGQAFRITTAGESHGPGNLVIVDGCPPGLPLGVDDLIPDLARRRPGQSAIVTQRDEPDAPEILSGVFEGKTTGTSIAILIRNRDQRSRDYAAIKGKYRPGHADHTYDAKYGFRDYRGGGRSERPRDDGPRGGGSHREEADRRAVRRRRRRLRETGRRRRGGRPRSGRGDPRPGWSAFRTAGRTSCAAPTPRRPHAWWR